MICTPMSFGNHDWHEVGRRRVPAWGSFSTNMPPEPDGTVEYVDYRCRRCGATQSDETLYSFRKNPPSGPSNP